MTTKEEQEQAVIEAAMDWHHQNPEWRTASMDGHPARELHKACHALNAPQPVKPSEVAPGRLFRFAEGAPGRPTNRVFRTKMGEYPWQNILAFTDEPPGGTEGKFSHSDLIIPLPEGGELEDAKSRKAYEDTRDEESFTDAEVTAMLSARNKEGK